MAKDTHLEDIRKMFPGVPIAEMERQHYTEPQPIVCKWCGSPDIMKRGFRKGVQEYVCQRCRRKFIEKDAPYGMRTPVDQIGAALGMFYEGMSLSAISRRLAETYGNPVNPSSVYRWVVKYTTEALRVTDRFTAQAGKMWVVDETVLKIGGGNLWFWDVIDDDTRFLLGSHLSKTRQMMDVVTVMRRSWQRAGGKAPKYVVSDSLGVYPDGIERVFGAYSRHVQTRGFSDDINTNLIERFHSTLKTRTRVLRGLKSLETAELILDGFLVNYNFFRPHMTLENRTPADVAGIDSPYKNWTDVVRLQVLTVEPGEYAESKDALSQALSQSKKTPERRIVRGRKDRSSSGLFW
jgi:transposase-like protein